MIHKEDLEQRLEDLGWTLYKLAKQFSEMRAVDGDVSPATRYHSAIGKAMENPAKSKLETIEGIVQALNGELTIVWEPGRVVTVRLDDEQMAALEERAKTEGTTVSKVAEQLLQVALSGSLVQKPKKLTDLVIAEEAKIYRSFHPLIASAYSAVQRPLGSGRSAPAEPGERQPVTRELPESQETSLTCCRRHFDHTRLRRRSARQRSRWMRPAMVVA